MNIETPKSMALLTGINENNVSISAIDPDQQRRWIEYLAKQTEEENAQKQENNS